jgi:diaminopimelate decarboxylase
MREILSLFPETATLDANGQLYLGGCAVEELKRAFGTPLYIFDELTLRRKCQAFRAALATYYPARGEAAHASKAYLCTALAQLFAEEGLFMDVVSGGEAYVARAAGFPMERTIFHGNAKPQAELQQALEWGVGRIAVDNLDELRLLGQVAAGRSAPVRIWLRLSPGIEAHTHAYVVTGVLDSKFGLPVATGDAERAVKLALSLPGIELVGIHAHIGSQILDPQAFIETIGVLIGFAAEMKRKYGFDLREFSPGGGLGVRYTLEDNAPSIEDFVALLARAVIQNCQAHGLALPMMVLEPGRAIVGPAGVALYTIQARKEIPGVRTYLSVDGGMADNIRPALYQAKYSALAANKADAPLVEKATIAGRYCESGDILIRDVELPHLKAGDLLALPTAGAYCLAMASNYNLSCRPAVVLVKEGKARLMQRRESYEDLVRRDLRL